MGRLCHFVSIFAAAGLSAIREADLVAEYATDIGPTGDALLTPIRLSQLGRSGGRGGPPASSSTSHGEHDDSGPHDDSGVSALELRPGDRRPRPPGGFRPGGAAGTMNIETRRVVEQPSPESRGLLGEDDERVAATVLAGDGKGNWLHQLSVDQLQKLSDELGVVGKLKVPDKLMLEWGVSDEAGAEVVGLVSS